MLQYLISKFVVALNVNISCTSAKLILPQVLCLHGCANAPNFLIYGSKCGNTDLQFLPTVKVRALQLYSYFVPFWDAPSLFVVGCKILFPDVILTTQEMSPFSSASLRFPVAQKDDVGKFPAPL